jgi:hypothetical protein
LNFCIALNQIVGQARHIIPVLEMPKRKIKPKVTDYPIELTGPDNWPTWVPEWWPEDEVKTGPPKDIFVFNSFERWQRTKDGVSHTGKPLKKYYRGIEGESMEPYYAMDTDDEDDVKAKRAKAEAEPTEEANTETTKMESDDKKPKFYRFTAKACLLTYPALAAGEVTKEQNLSFLESKKDVEEYSICWERHEKPDDPERCWHIHAYVKCKKAPNFKDSSGEGRFFDYKVGGKASGRNLHPRIDVPDNDKQPWKVNRRNMILYTMKGAQTHEEFTALKENGPNFGKSNELHPTAPDYMQTGNLDLTATNGWSKSECYHEIRRRVDDGASTAEAMQALRPA